MGSQWAGMAKDLMKFQVFEQTVRKAADVLITEGFDLYAVFESDDESTFDNVLNSFVSITVMQVSIVVYTALKRSPGVLQSSSLRYEGKFSPIRDCVFLCIFKML